MSLRLSHHTVGVLLVASAAIAWSLGGLFFRAIDLDPWTTSFWRSFFAAIFLAVYIFTVQRRAFYSAVREDTRHGLIVSLGVAVSMLTFLPALALTSVANVALIYATAPVLTAVLGHVLLRERLDAITVTCALAVTAGAGLLFIGSGSGPSLGGDALALASTLALVFVALAIRSRPGSSLLLYVCIANVLVAVIALPIAPTLAISRNQAILLILFAFLQVALSFTLFTIGARMLPAKETALINAMESPLSPMWVWLAFGERPSPTTIISGLIIITAVLIYIAVASRQQDHTQHDHPQIDLPPKHRDHL